MLKIAWNSYYAHPLPEGHRFPMLKYNLVPEQLIYEGTINEKNLFDPDELEEKYILNTHHLSYWNKLKEGTLTKSEIRKTGFPFSERLVKRERIIAKGTVLSSLFALEFGIGMNIAGGTHHAFTDHGEGFCLLNDIAIAANYLMKEKKIRKILVIDLDVHQGNGTAEIFQKNPDVFTFSMHGAHNYPLKKEQSDLDIPLPDYTNDQFYLKQLDYHLKDLIDRFEPEFIFYQSGVDVLSTDKLGRLSLTLAGCKERDRKVLSLCRKNNIPVAVSLGGGYSQRLSDIIEAHANTYRLAMNIYF